MEIHQFSPTTIHPHHGRHVRAKSSTNRINPFKIGQILNLKFLSELAGFSGSD